MTADPAAQTDAADQPGPDGPAPGRAGPGAATITRRAALGVLGAAGAAALLSYRPRNPPPAGRVVVEYWEKWTGVEGQAMQRIVDRFNTIQDRLWINHVVVSEINVKSMIAIAGGDAPDLVGLWSYLTPSFVEQGALLPLEDFASRAPVVDPPRPDGASRRPIDEELYAPAIWSLLTHRGRQWAGVNSASSVAMYYNRRLFREVGLDPDRPPRTIEELDAVSDRLTRFESGPDSRITRAGFWPREPGWWPWAWPYFFGGGWYDAASDTITGELAENVDAYRWVKSYRDRFGADQLSGFSGGFGNYNSPQMPFLVDKVAMVQQGPWLATNINRLAPRDGRGGLDFDYGAGPFPVPERIYDPGRPIALTECDTVSIPRNARRPEEAWAFLAYLQRPETQEELAVAHSKPAPMREVSPGFYEGHPNPHARMHTEVMASPRAFKAPPIPAWQFVTEETRKVRDRVWNDGVGVEAELAAFQSRAEAEHRNQRRRLERQRRAGGPAADV